MGDLGPEFRGSVAHEVHEVVERYEEGVDVLPQICGQTHLSVTFPADSTSARTHTLFSDLSTFQRVHINVQRTNIMPIAARCQNNQMWAAQCHPGEYST